MYDADLNAVDWAAAEQIVCGEVRALAGRAPRLASHAALEDLRQEGYEAIIRATRTYDPSRSVPFASYARRAVSYALLSYLRRSDPLPERSRRDLRKIIASEQALLEDGVSHPTVQEIAAHSGLSPQRVVRVRRERFELQEIPLSQTIAEWGFPGLTGDTPEDRYLLWEARTRIRATINSFTTRQQDVFVQHFLEGRSVTQIALDLGVSKGRISQICADLRERLLIALSG